MNMDRLTAELILNPPRPVRVPPTVAGSNATTRLQAINTKFVINIISKIDEGHHFRNLIFYISEELNLSQPDAIDFFNRFWLKFPLVPRIIVRNNQSSMATSSIRNLISTPSLVLVFTTGRNDPIMELTSQGLKGMRWLETIFILFPFLSTAEYHKSLDTFNLFSSIFKDVLRWTWEKQFISTLLLTIQDNVYQLSPYPTQTFVNKTENWQTCDFFRRLNNNMKGYLVSSPVMYDMPRVFKGADQKTIYGTSGKLFLGFLQYVNATMHDTSANLTMKVFDLPSLLELLAEGVYETLIHSYTDLLGNYSSSFSYPIGINDWCLMVPYRNNSQQELYVREALQTNVWFLLLASTFYMGFSIWFCTPRRPRDLSAALLQCVCTLTNSPPISVIKTSTIRMRYLNVLFAIMGLVASNMYISKMASYFTSAPAEQQINTLQDIIDANLRIMVQAYEYNALSGQPNQYTPRFMQQVDVTDSHVIQAHRDMLNSTFGYFVSSDRWETVTMLQKHLKKPIFRLTKICSGPFYHVFPLHADSHLRLPLHNYILISRESGLGHHWKWEAFWEALYMKLIRLIIVNEEPLPLSMSFLSSMMRTWCLGLILAGLIFILEMKWHQHVFSEYCLKSYNKLSKMLKRRRSNKRRRKIRM